MTPPTVAVSIDHEGQTVVKRVRRSMLTVYERAGWHVVPRRRFKVAKRKGRAVVA